PPLLRTRALRLSLPCSRPRSETADDAWRSLPARYLRSPALWPARLIALHIGRPRCVRVRWYQAPATATAPTGAGIAQSRFAPGNHDREKRAGARFDRHDCPASDKTARSEAAAAHGGAHTLVPFRSRSGPRLSPTRPVVGVRPVRNLWWSGRSLTYRPAHRRAGRVCEYAGR